MTRIEWLKWAIMHGDPQNRARNLKIFCKLEMYRFGWRLSGHKIAHWLEEESLPAGKYFLIEKDVPAAVRLLDKVFSVEKEAHAEYVPYSPALEEEMKRAGKTVRIVEISYQLRAELGADG
ncbi:MAG TPA: hypothetical protein VIL74_24695 [Pyrinomonadaceae bacterium]|jgi:hypothetical protein